MSSPSKRRDMDVMKLMMTDYKVEMVNDSMSEFFVEFKGPTESLYQGGVWRVRVELPEAYPYKSPSIGFVSRIYHPNIDEMSGSVCLDVINQTWSPMFDLVNIFEVFLPQLLLYPNPSDPLNGEAASLMMRDKPSYEQKVKEHCVRYAKPEDILGQDEEEESESEDEKNYSSSDEEMDVEVKDGQEGRRRCMEASRYTWSIAMSKTQGNLKRESHISTYGARKKFVDATCVLQMAEWPLEIDHLSHSEEKKGDQGSSKLKWLTWVFVYFRPTLLGTSLRASSNGAPFDSTAKAGDPIIIELPIDTIRGPLKRTRANDPEKVKELMQSIQEIGLQVPIDMLVVDGDYYGLSGCHRYEAHQRLGLQLSDAKFAEEPRRH